MQSTLSAEAACNPWHNCCMTRPPRPEQIPHSATLHGITRQDPYHWLRDDNWQQVMRQPDELEARIRAHLDLENAHTDQALAATNELQEALFAELKGRIKEDESSVPALPAAPPAQQPEQKPAPQPSPDGQ